MPRDAPGRVTALINTICHWVLFVFQIRNSLFSQQELIGKIKPFEEKWWWTWWGGWWGRHRGRWPWSRQPCHSTGFPGYQKSQKYQVFEGEDLDETKEDDDPGSQKAKSERPGWSSELRGVNAHRIALWWWWSSWVWVIWTWRWWQWCWWLSWRWRRRRWWWWWPCRIPPGEHFSSKTGRNWKSEGRLGCQRAWKAKWKLKLFWNEKKWNRNENKDCDVEAKNLPILSTAPGAGSQ